MKHRVLMSFILFLLEVITFVGISLLLRFDMASLSASGCILFVLLFVNEHYLITSNLIWEELWNLVKCFVCYLIILLFLVHPNTLWDYVNCILLPSIMFVACLIYSRTLRIIFRQRLARKTLVIGCGYSAYRIGKIANNNRFAMTRVLAYVCLDRKDICDEFKNNKLGKIHDRYTIYDYDQLDYALKKHHIDQVIIALPNSSKELVNELMKDLFDKVETIKYLPNLDILMTFNSRIQDFDGMLLISTAKIRGSIIQSILKRIFDICVSLVGIMTLIPLSLYVRHKNHKANDYAPIFFTQTRIGKNGKPIKIYKYRTMVPNAEQVLEKMMEEDPKIKEEYLKNKKLINDPRITEAGHFLRKSSLDEFPQFINVLKGEMSFVGPRPYLYREKDDMGIYYTSIVRCKPGITGMWQANGRSDVSFDERCKLDDYYYRNWNFGLDMIIVYKTVKGVLYGKGAL